MTTLFCPECECAQDDGDTCWQCGGVSLQSDRPKPWPIAVVWPGAQIVQFSKGHMPVVSSGELARANSAA